MLTPLVQGAVDVAKDGVKKVAEAAPATAAAATTATAINSFIAIGGPIAVAVLGKVLEKLCDKAQEHFDPGSIHRLCFDSLAGLMKQLLDEANGRFDPDDLEQLRLWHDIAQVAAKEPAWAERLAATELPAELLTAWYLTGKNAEAHWPAMQQVLEQWTAAARWIRANPSLAPPIVPFASQPLSASKEFQQYLAGELPTRWTVAIRQAVTTNSNQQHFRQLQLEIATAVHSKLDRVARHATAPPLLTTVEQMERRLGNRLIDLLRPQHPHALPLTGRDPDLNALLDWLHSPNSISIRCIVGKGGSGKTRIAIELLKRATNWQAGFVSSEAFESFFQHRGFGEWEWTRPTLFIIDYASSQARPLERLVKDLRDRDAGDMPPLRILLLDRVAEKTSGWYAGFSESRIEGAERLFHPYAPQSLSPLDPAFDRRNLLEQAAQTCAKFEGNPNPGPPPQALNGAISSPQLADPLVLIMAGFCAASQGDWSALTLSRIDLASALAEHEMRRIRSAATAMYPDRLLLSLASYVTIRGAIPRNQVRDEFASEARQLGYSNIEPVPLEELMLNAVTPGEARPIEPDIIGEAFVLSHARTIAADAQAMVVRAAKRQPAAVTQFVIRTAQDFGEGQELQPYQWISAVLDYAQQEDPVLLYQLEAAIPEVCPFAARNIALTISTRMLQVLAPLVSSTCHSAPEYARLLSNVAVRQGDAGQREAALAAVAEAVKILRELAQGNREAFLPDLAGSLNNLANRQSALGQREAALTTAAEAVELYRELAEWNREAFLPNLAGSLNNLAAMKSAVGQREAALATVAEAMNIRRELTEGNREAYLPRMAGSLNNMAVMQRAMGQREAALATAAETVKYYRELALKNREAFLPDLAGSLNNLAAMQSDVGQTEVALTTAAEAVDLYRELTEANRKAFLPDLATSLHNLANRQSEVGQREVALATVAEAVKIRRELAEGNWEAYLPNLAAVLNSLAANQSQLGQSDAALATVAEAVNQYRELAEGNREAFLPELAMSLNNMANIQSVVGQREAAFATATEAVNQYRELAEGNREAFLPDLAGSLNNLANRQSEVGQPEAALASAAEAVKIRRELAKANRETYLPKLAISLGALAQFHTAREDYSSSQACLIEALEQLLPMLELHPTHFAQLALSLAKAYVTACADAAIPLDGALCSRIVAILNPSQ